MSLLVYYWRSSGNIKILKVSLPTLLQGSVRHYFESKNQGKINKIRSTIDLNYVVPRATQFWEKQFLQTFGHISDHTCLVFHSTLEKVITQGYKALNLQYFFTAGPDEVKAWTIQKGTKAPQAAGRIHTDFEKGFIMAEVMNYVDFKEEGSEAATKAAGKYRQKGKDYTVEDGDIIFFKFNAGAGLTAGKKK